MSMQPLLIELGVEELPVKALPGLSQAFFDGIVNGLEKRGVAVERGDAKPLSTPRRLAVRGLSLSVRTPLPGPAGHDILHTGAVLDILMTS